MIKDVRVAPSVWCCFETGPEAQANTLTWLKGYKQHQFRLSQSLIIITSTKEVMF